jgi:ubiquinone/menaquinone biosynthesis C-methylase UbiE
MVERVTFYEKWYIDQKKLYTVIYDVGHIIRRNELANYFKSYKGKIILDVGVGLGDILLAFHPDNTFVGIDISLNALRYVKERGFSVINADAQYNVFRNKSIDCVLAIDVLEHVPNDVLVLQELSYIIKDNGYLVLSVPLYEFTNYAREAYGHLRHYTLKKLLKLLSDNNFEIVSSLYTYPIFDRLYAGVSYKHKTEYLNFKNFLYIINKVLNKIFRDNKVIYQRRIYHALLPFMIFLAKLEGKVKCTNLQARHKAFLLVRKKCL